MQTSKTVKIELQKVEKDLEHLAELRAMRDLNQGYSLARDKLFGEIQRIMNEKRDVLRWVLELEVSIDGRTSADIKTD